MSPSDNDKPRTPLHELVSWAPEPTDTQSALAKYQANPTPAGLRPLVEQLQPTITKAVNAYAPNASPVVHDRARLLAAKAIQSYQPSRSVPLEAHVYRQLQAIQRLAPQIQDPMPLPERLRRDRGHLLATIDQLTNELGREPSDEELSTKVGMSPRRLTKVRAQMRASLPASAIEEPGEDDENDDVVAHQRTPEEDWIDAVYHDLGDSDRLILQHRTGYRGAPILPGNEIAKMLRVSPAAVSKRLQYLQSKLDEFHDPAG